MKNRRLLPPVARRPARSPASEIHRSRLVCLTLFRNIAITEQAIAEVVRAGYHQGT